MVYQIDPLRDPRWPAFLERHPAAQSFHSPGWLESLRQTYGYEPVVFTTTCPGSDLENGIVFCRIHSWLTGRRLVSLPFSDHCDPLLSNPEEMETLWAGVKADLEANRLKYVEFRPTNISPVRLTGVHETESFCLHRLDLHPKQEDLFRGFHKDCVQRKIRRAEREHLTYAEGRSEVLLSQFYNLLVVTRRRQQLPPQPLTWFRNLTAYMGDKLQIRVASKNGEPVASILTLRYKNTLAYKYGCSEKSFHNLGGMHLLFWHTIQDAKRDGLVAFDLGRSEWENEGLILFKDRWGAQRTPLTYLRFPEHQAEHTSRNLEKHLAKWFFSVAPDAFAVPLGRVLYRHIG
jgi:Acetyltransferase (GNAT) domain